MIKFENISKSFSGLKALDDINLILKPKTFNLLVGPNASGKSTLIKSILGLVNVNGNLSVENKNIRNTFEYRNKIGYMPQSFSFPANLTVNEILELVKSLRSNKIYDEEILYKFQIDKIGSKKLINLSGGTKQKVNAAIAFLFDPEILILDEPTAGLDMISSNILKEKLIGENQKGKTILVTSHVFSEFESIAENIILLSEGKLNHFGLIKDLLNLTNVTKLEKALAKWIKMKN